MNRTLELLIQIAHGVAAQFGSNCEVVIHDLAQKNMEHPIVYIENGHVSSRLPGDGPSGIVLETLKKDPKLVEDKLSYLTRTADGRILKSSTMFIRGSKGAVHYIFSLNYDITALLNIETSLRPLVEPAQDADKPPRRITNNVNDLLDNLIEQSVSLTGKPVPLMNKSDKVKAIRYLNDAGAFLITHSGDKVSSYFGISKFTLYSYLDAVKAERPE